MKQLSKDDIYLAKSIVLFLGDTIYVEIPEEKQPYCITKGDKLWVPGDQLWNYPEYEALIYYTRILTPDEAIDLLIKWGCLDSNTDTDLTKIQREP